MANGFQTLLVIFAFFAVVAKFKIVQGYQPEPFQHLLIVDESDENVQRNYIVNKVLQNFPHDSTIGKMIPVGDTVSSALIDNATFEEFSANQYKKMAEIVFYFVKNDTKLDGEPKSSSKKKTIVVVFGSSVPETWRNVATDENHLFLVTKESNSSMIFERLMRQINSDSKFYCDIDMYIIKRGHKCRACSNVCGTNPDQRSATCSLRCPYFWSKLKKEELAENSSTSPTPVTVYAVKDNKHTVMYGVLGVIGGGIVVVLIGVIVYFFKKKKQLTPGNSDRDVTAYQETGGKGHEGSPLVNSADRILDTNMLDDGQSRTNSDDNIVSLMESGCSSVGEGGAGPSEPNLENRSISVSFKNGREADLNAHFSDENVRNVH